MAVRELDPRDEESLFSLDADEQRRGIDYGKSVGIKLAAGAVCFPLNLVKTLVQLGHEPFPLHTGKAFILCGRDAKFLPNGFSYGRSLYRNIGLRGMYTGVGAYICSNVTGASVAFATNIYMDRHFPNVGGKPENIDKDERLMTDRDSFRRMLREAIRETIVKSVAVVASRPFTVIMVRKIAQLISDESKYVNVLQSLLLIGNEEGIGGYFSGLVPQLIAEVITIWGMHSLTFIIERTWCNCVPPSEEEADDNVSKAMAAGRHHVISGLLTFVVQPIAYPYALISTVMAVTGSGLAISLLPYSPTFGSWQDAWQYLSKGGQLSRGSKLLHRMHTGAVTVGRDRLLYAATKHHVA